MAYQEIGLGTVAADGTGDSIRVGGDKINDNFVELYTLLGTGTALSSGISATSSVITLAAPTITGVVGGTQTSATITTLATTTVNATTLNGAIGTAAQTNITSLGTLTALQVDNLNINGNAITSTAGTDLTIAPVSGQQIVLDDTIIIDAGVVTGATSITSTSFVGALTGNASGTAATVTGAAQTNITSLGTLTALAVDDISLNGKVLIMTGDTDDTVTFTTAANGTLSIVTVDNAAAAANIQITADGTVDIDSAGVLTLDSGAAINIEPAAGSAILLDGTISVDAGVVTGATSITSTAFVGALTGNASGTAATVTGAAQTNITSLGTLTALTVDDISLNGKVLIMTGDTDDTVTFTTAANGTLSIVTVDDAAAAANIQITADGTVDIDSAGVLTLDSGAAINIEPAGGSAILLDGTISVDAGVVTGATSITSTAFVGALSGTLGAFLDVAGNYIQTEKGGDISSASPLVIDTDGDYFDVTGTTNFSVMTVAADRQFTLQFDGALTMTHHATNLDLPGEANITTAAGDVGVFQSTGANTVQCISFTKADGTAVSAGAGGGPSKGTAPSTFYRTNGKVQNEDIVISNHSATFSAVHGAETLSRGTDDGFADDMNVRLTGGDLPNGFVIDTDYFVRDVASATMKLALTIAGTAVTISDNGSGTNTVFEVINAGVTGPITIKAGNSLTIPSGSRVVIQ